MSHCPQLELLLGHLASIGLTVTAGERPGELFLHGPAAEKTPAIIETLRSFKPQLLVRLGSQREPTPEPAPAADPEDESCRACGLTVTADIRPRLADPLWCSIGGARATRELLAQQRCPYKPRQR